MPAFFTSACQISPKSEYYPAELRDVDIKMAAMESPVSGLMISLIKEDLNLFENASFAIYPIYARDI